MTRWYELVTKEVRCTWSNEQGEREEGGGGREGGEGKEGERESKEGQDVVYTLFYPHLALNLSRTYLTVLSLYSRQN